MSAAVARIVWEDDEGREHSLPAVWAICGQCQGNGSHSRDLGAYTGEEMAEQGPEWCEDYMAGHFDRECEVCRGSGKVREVDRDRAEPAELALYDEHQDAEARYAAECAHERRMGY